MSLDSRLRGNDDRNLLTFVIPAKVGIWLIPKFFNLTTCHCEERSDEAIFQ